MKRTVTLIAGLTLASGAGFAQQQQTQEYDPDRDITTETERDRGTGMDQQRSDSPVQSEYGTETEEYGTETERDYERAPETERDPTRTTERDYDTDTGTQTGETGQQDRMTGQQDQPGQAGQHAQSDITAMSAEELSGKSIVSVDGEEIGEINEVGYSSTHQDRVATVEVGGFLGVGEKRIAIPLTELEQSETEEGALQTSMTREEIESEEEFDETGFDIGQ